MKKISTVQAFGKEILKEQKLTIGVDLGDRWSFYCVLEEAGKIILEQKPSTERISLTKSADGRMATGAAYLNGNRLTGKKVKCALTSTGLLMEGLESDTGNPLRPKVITSRLLLLTQRQKSRP